MIKSYPMQTGIHSRISTPPPASLDLPYPTLKEWAKKGKECGYKILVFGDHFNNFNEEIYEKYRKELEECSDKDILLISGIDHHYCMTPIGHHLACDCFIKGLPKINDFPSLVHKKKGISWLSHYGWSKPSLDFVEMEDAWEVWSMWDKSCPIELIDNCLRNRKYVPYLASAEPKTLNQLSKNQEMTFLLMPSLTKENVKDAILKGYMYMANSMDIQLYYNQTNLEGIKCNYPYEIIKLREGIYRIEVRSGNKYACSNPIFLKNDKT